MNKKEARKKVVGLLNKKEKINTQIKKTVIKYMECKTGDHISTMKIPYKKWIREELNIVI